jgi:hypothetical protein
MDLQDFLARERRIPWRWGVKDCTLWVADWINERRGIDPAAPYRGQYDNADSCHALLKREGGFMPLVGWRLDEAGLDRTQSPRDGDVGIVSAPISLADRMPVVQTIMAIRGSGAWIMRMAPRGFHVEDVPTVTAWKV